MRRSQSSRRPFALAAGVGLAIGSMVVAGPAGAADPDLVEEALATLGIDDAPAGLVDDIASLLPDDIGADADADSDAATRLEAAIRNWEIVAPEWRDVPEGLMAQVRECRDETTDDPVDEGEPTETTIPDGTDESDDTTETTVAEGDDVTDDATDDATVGECGEQLRVRLRIEHAERLVARFTERIAEAERLPEQARAEVLAAMTAVRDRAEQRLRDIVESDDDAVDAVLEATGRDRAVLARVQEQVAEQAGELNRRSEQANAAPGRGSDTADTDDTDDDTDGGPETDGGTSTGDSDGARNDDDRRGQGEGTANTTVPERSGGQGGDAGDGADDVGDDDRGNSGDAPGRTTVVDDSDGDEADDPQDGDGRSEGRPDDNGRSDEEGNGR